MVKHRIKSMVNGSYLYRGEDVTIKDVYELDGQLVFKTDKKEILFNKSEASKAVSQFTPIRTITSDNMGRTKTCNACYKDKSVEHFADDGRTNDGLKRTCNECIQNQPIKRRIRPKTMEKTETKKDQDQETLFDKQSEETVNERQCRICGCTDDDYSQCINKYTGQRCHWVGDDLCSACLLAPSSAAEKDMSDLRRTEPAERKCQVCGGIDDDCNDWIEEDLCSVCWGQIEALVKRYRPAATYQNGLDPELQAMNVLSTALKPLNDKERARVLEWVIGKLGIKPMREVTIG